MPAVPVTSCARNCPKIGVMCVMKFSRRCFACGMDMVRLMMRAFGNGVLPEEASKRGDETPSS